MITTSAMAAVNPFTRVTPMSDGSDSSGGASAQSATISANDFLTLLVTEMKNQDPTAQTDPNEYINQLVQVNSLEQLIQINQNLSTALGNTSGNDAPASSARKTYAANTPAITPASTNAGPDCNSNRTDSGIIDAHNHLAVGSGNLGVPVSIPSAQRVAQSLSGHP